MRLIAGVILPLEPDAAELFCTNVLQSGLEKVGLGWVSRAVHASHLADPERFEGWLSGEQGEPAGRAGLDPRNQHHASRIEGQRVLRALRRHVAHEVALHGGWALGVCEHGCPTTRQGLRGPLPYRRMILAWLEHATLELARARNGPGHLHAVIAHRARPAPQHASIWGGRLAARKIREIQVDLSTEVAAAAERRGLQIADLLAHGLGPGGLQHMPPAAATIASRTQAFLDEVVAQRFDSQLRYIERDALLDFRHVGEAMLALDRWFVFEQIASRASALPQHSPLPEGTFPASLEACANTVPQLWSLCE